MPTQYLTHMTRGAEYPHLQLRLDHHAFRPPRHLFTREFLLNQGLKLTAGFCGNTIPFVIEYEQRVLGAPAIAPQNPCGIGKTTRVMAWMPENFLLNAPDAERARTV